MDVRLVLSDLYSLLIDIKNSHGVTLLSHPPQDPWLNNRINERIAKALQHIGELMDDTPPQLTDDDCDAFRRLAVSFNDMIRAAHTSGACGSTKPVMN